ncbi:MAG TPA: hypothetical protein VMP00_13970 [Burkholderiales bacterium]|nr:hypothetical protein [Burkholderiales bacterium]
MKTKLITPLKRAGLASLLAASMIGISSPATADAPNIELLTFNGIGGPTPTIFVPSFPAVINVAMSVTHSEVRDLHDLDLKLNSASVLNGGSVIDTPFKLDGNNGCNAAMIPANGVATCNVTPPSDASATLKLEIPDNGQYSVLLSIRHRGLDGDSDSDVETIEVALLNVEYPAPPAVANAYINSQSSAIRKQFSSKVRGCVISMIAENHAKDSAYGDKGGPYEEETIQRDVSFFSFNYCNGPGF